MTPEHKTSSENPEESFIEIWEHCFKEVEAKFNASVRFGKSGDDNPIILMTNGEGRLMGSVEFQFLNKDSLYISYTEIEDLPIDFRRQGVHTALIARILTEYPHIKVLIGDLADDNKSLYEKALEQGLSVEEAIKSTPAYKTRVKLGFSQVDFKKFEEHTSLMLISKRDDYQNV